MRPGAARMDWLQPATMRSRSSFLCQCWLGQFAAGVHSLVAGHAMLSPFTFSQASLGISQLFLVAGGHCPMHGS